MSTLEKHLLQDLQAGRSTADSLAQRLGVHTEVATRMLEDLERRNMATHSMLGSSLKVYALTELGWQRPARSKAAQ